MSAYMWRYMSERKRFLALIFQLKVASACFRFIDINVLVRLKRGLGFIAIQKVN